MIPTKTIVDKANAEITAGSITDLEYTQLAGTDVFLDRATPKSVANVASLPAAANNEGIIYYVTNEAVYYFSDGTNWRKDFTSDYEVKSDVAYGWGRNFYGQLGDNTTSDRSSPVTTVGGIITWSQLSGGFNHNLGIINTGIAYAWGANGQGQLGDGTQTSRSSPVTVVGGITNWNKISAGYKYTAGTTSTGIAYAWGVNENGQLGDNTTSSRSSPVTVIGGITNWNTVSAGRQHTIGLTSTGIVYSWGRNQYGQLGDNSFAGARSSPVTVVGGITNWNKISAGDNHNHVITLTGIVYAWGRNSYGNLGDNTTTVRSSPVTVVGGITNWSLISGGTTHSLGITSIGIAYAWGNGLSGKLGDGTTTTRSSPVTVVGGITNWSSMSGGGSHSLGLTSSGIAYAWGFNSNGQLGDNTTSNRSSPVTVIGGITNWSQLSAGSAADYSLGIFARAVATKGFV